VRRAAARGAHVLIGDPGRDHLPYKRMTILASYPAPGFGDSAEPYISRMNVLQPR